MTEKHALDGAVAYLCGAIEHASDDGIGWRRRFIDLLQKADLSIDCIDPTNKPGGECGKPIDEAKQHQIDLQKGRRWDELRDYVHSYRRLDLRFIDYSDLVVAAIAIHNVPEGLAVGVAAAAGADHGMSLGIAIQNVPEGWIVASAMLALGAAPLRAALIALGTGLVEPVGGLFGVIASTVAGAALPLALAAAAGAMLWVVSHEMIPASHKPGRIGAGTAGLAAGFAVMTTLASVF